MDMDQFLEDARAAALNRYPLAAEAAKTVTTTAIPALREAVREIVEGNTAQSAAVHRAQIRAGVPGEQATNWALTQLATQLAVFFDMAVGPVGAPGDDSEGCRDRLVLELTAALRVAHSIEVERAKLGGSGGNVLFVAPAGLDLSKLGGLPGGRG